MNPSKADQYCAAFVALAEEVDRAACAVSNAGHRARYLRKLAERDSAEEVRKLARRLEGDARKLQDRLSEVHQQVVETLHLLAPQEGP